MIGDMSPPVSYQRRPYVRAAAIRPPPPPDPGIGSRFAPSVRGFKIAENQSPVPQDRIFFGFNYYDDVSKSLNKFYEAQIEGIQVYRYTWGFEKTFNEGLGSIGMRLPLNNAYAQSRVPTLNEGGNSTALGNLTVFLKHVFYIEPVTGSVFSGGVAITPRTAGRQFAGASFLGSSNTTTLQPYFAFYLNFDKLYFQGFSALDVPTDPKQPLLYYNDFGLGYYLFNDLQAEGLITAVAPTVEVHINTPLNHTGAYDRLDNFGTPDIVDITSGLNVRFGQSSTLSLGAVVPVTGPRPFDIEATLLLNVYFGRSRRGPAFPIIGG